MIAYPLKRKKSGQRNDAEDEDKELVPQKRFDLLIWSALIACPARLDEYIPT